MGLLNDPVIILSENDKIVSEQAAVSGIMNECYVNVARDIGNDLSPDEIETHSSIRAIGAKFQNVTPFYFNPNNTESIQLSLESLAPKKPRELIVSRPKLSNPLKIRSQNRYQLS